MTKIVGKTEKPFVVIMCHSASDVSSLLGVDLDSIKVPDVAQDVTTNPEKRYVYGLKGIQELFNVSHLTAQRYKDGILKDAVFQSGRKIVVDVEKAMELFNSRR